MAVQRHDQRLSYDRFYDYESARRLREDQGVASPQPGPFHFIPPMRAQYRLGLALAVVVVIASMFLAAYVHADTARLQLSEQEYGERLGALQQSVDEDWGARVEAENALYSGGVAAAGVIYPTTTRYLVLTNIPQASGKRLVEELYPLSRNIIRLDP